MKYLVLDTNVYLHYKDFEQVDWKTLMADDVTICVPFVVLSEIDKHKDQSRGKIQKRAKKLSSRFSEVFLQGTSANIALKEMDNPPSTAFDDTQFHKDINDDWIILSALHSTYDPSTLIIVSGDNGILMKAKRFGLGFFKMPDDLLLSEELSDEEKEIKKLREQLSRHENRLPSPVIEFKDRTDRLLINKPVFIDVKQELDTYEAQLKASHPYQSARQDRVDGSTHVVLKSLSLDYRPMDPWEKYNKELDEYFEKKLELKRCQLEQQLMEQRFVRIDFWLGNTGTTSLGDTIIFISFPPNVSVYDQESKKYITLEDPKEPVLRDSHAIYNEGSPFSLYTIGKKHKDLEIWDADKALDTQEFKYSNSKLIHNLCERLNGKDPVYVDIANCGNFTIKWTVFDSKLIEPVFGELHVIVQENQVGE